MSEKFFEKIIEASVAFLEKKMLTLYYYDSDNRYSRSHFLLRSTSKSFYICLIIHFSYFNHVTGYQKYHLYLQIIPGCT